MKPLALSISEFCSACSIGRTKVYALIRDGELRVAKVGRRTLILMESAEAFLSKAAARSLEKGDR